MTLTAKNSGGTQSSGAHTVVSFNTWSSNQVLTVNAGGKKPHALHGGERRGNYLETHQSILFFLTRYVLKS